MQHGLIGFLITLAFIVIAVSFADRHYGLGIADMLALDNMQYWAQRAIEDIKGAIAFVRRELHNIF